MASITLSRSVRGRRPNLVTTVLNALAVWRQRRHLGELDAHLLRDIGVTEQDLQREMERPVWDVPQNWRF